MPNPIKYTTDSPQERALIKGNYWIGTGDIGKGPSTTTGYYQGPSPAEGGYVVYLYKEGAPGDLSYFSAANDSELISFTNGFLDPEQQEPFTTVQECFNYYNSSGQTDKFCINKDIVAIPTDSIYTHYDFGQVTCRPNSNSSSRELGKNGEFDRVTLFNEPTFTTANGGGIVLDGTNDYIRNSDQTLVVDSGNGLTICTWFSSVTPAAFNTPFFHNGPNFTWGYLRYSNSVGTPLGMEWFYNPGIPGGFYRGETKMAPDFSYPIFFCVNFINRGEGNYGCYLIMNNGTSGLVGGNFGLGYSPTGSNVLDANPSWGAFLFGASTQQGRYLNGTVNMFTGYNRSFFPVTTDVPADDTIPAEIQQYYNATKGRFGL